MDDFLGGHRVAPCIKMSLMESFKKIGPIGDLQPGCGMGSMFLATQLKKNQRQVGNDG